MAGAEADMGTYRSGSPFAGRLTPEDITQVRLPPAPWYRRDEVDALLHRLAYELGERARELEIAWAESQRIKRALRLWQSERAGSGAHARRTTTGRRVRRTTLPKRLPSESAAGSAGAPGRHVATHRTDTEDSAG
ncbi:MULTISPECIES: DivIVA domain-containing protein [unclassified Micromonospora]|uniref:DivIVA domain-containing protein n=1 Tax=unclassified Micromonospora TaxID=2617518 RepID=UPI00259D0A96|nr:MULTISPECIES: DivIVA domain-containing protein [unclassified Micromonospora]MDM4781185.1 DivIVA domain-containing protein [Micromonospora sp. b486]